MSIKYKVQKGKHRMENINLELLDLKGLYDYINTKLSL